MDFGLAGKGVIVTGATANIGRAIALEFASEGARVVAVRRDEAAGARVVELAKARGADQAVFVRADMIDRQAPQRIMAAAEALGPVLVLVNNVGGNVGSGEFIDSDPGSGVHHRPGLSGRRRHSALRRRHQGPTGKLRSSLGTARGVPASSQRSSASTSGMPVTASRCLAKPEKPSPPAARKLLVVTR